jgi:DNA-binding CsgD family transcriptional regulator/PAS domain-containing protein
MRLLLEEWKHHNLESVQRLQSGLCIIKKGIIHCASPSLVTMLGGGQESDVTGKAFSEFVAPECLPTVIGLPVFQEPQTGDVRSQPHPFIALRLDKHPFHADMQIETTISGGETALWGLIRNIDPFQNGACVSSKDTSLFQSVIETIPSPVVELDRSGAVLHANEAFKQMFFEPCQELNTTFLMHWAASSSDKQRLQEFLEEFRWRHSDFSPYLGHFKLKEGKSIPIRINWSLRRSDIGSLLGLVCVLAEPCDPHSSGNTASDQETELHRARRRLDAFKSALEVLLEKRKEDKRALEASVTANLQSSVFPCLEALAKSGLSKRQKSILNMIEAGLRDISSPFANRVSSRFYGLSPMEIRVAKLVRNGMANKEIAGILHLSKSTILTHRHHIRKKLGLKNKKINLRSHLLSFEHSDNT